MFYHFKNTTAAIALALGLTLAQPAAAATINFDNLTASPNADSDPVAIALGITFNNAAFLPDQDSFGVDIPGSEHWQVDNSVSTPVTAKNTSAIFWGLAPSGQNALDARLSPLLMHFAAAIDIGSFSVTLPDSLYGNLSPSDILFLDAAGNKLYDLVYDQGIPLATVSLPTTKMPGVQNILLASGTFYDNISVTAVPEADALWLLVSALPGLSGLRRRKS